MHESAASSKALRRPVRKAADRLHARAALQRAQQLAQRLLAFAPNNEVDDIDAWFIRVWREAGIVAAHDDADVRLERAQEPGDLERGHALEGHDREADDVGLELAHQPLDGPGDVRLRQNQVRNRDAMMGIDVAGQRGQGAVRHADRHRRHVLERVRHGKQQQVHREAPRRP